MNVYMKSQASIPKTIGNTIVKKNYYNILLLNVILFLSETYLVYGTHTDNQLLFACENFREVSESLVDANISRREPILCI